MISNITVTGVKYELDDTIKKYIDKKIGRLDRYIPRHARKSAQAEVVIRHIDQDNGNKYEVEVLLRVPDSIFTAKESTLNALAAVDIVEAKIVAQLRRYREERTDHRGPHDLLGRFKRSFKRG